MSRRKLAPLADDLAAAIEAHLDDVAGDDGEDGDDDALDAALREIDEYLPFTNTSLAQMVRSAIGDEGSSVRK